MAPSLTAKIVPAAPAEPDAPRDTPTDKQVSDFSRLTVARCTAHCLTRAFATTNQILLAQELAAKLQAMKLASQVKIYSPGYIEQCAAGPSCPVRGGVGCKRCSSSVS